MDTAKSDTEPMNTADAQLLRRLKASIIRRAPMDAASLLTQYSDAIVTDVLQQTDPRLARKILRLLPSDRTQHISQALTDDLGDQWARNTRYPEETIGRFMGPATGIISQHMTVAQTIDFIRVQSEQSNIFTYCYVVDDTQHLLGVIVMRDLLFEARETSVQDVMIDNPFRFNASTKISHAMLEVVHRHYPVYPVCDDAGVLVGLIQGYELFEEHAIEVSAQPGRMVGVDNEEHLSTPILTSFKYRHPWLQLNLLTAFLAAFVVGSFENTIQQIVVLAAFLPVLAGQSGNTGCQALAVTLRGMTLGEYKVGQGHKLLFKELKLGAANGVLVGITTAAGMFIYATLSDSSSTLTLCAVIFFAMLASCMASGVAGVVVPTMLKRLGADPVTASTIFVTTATDVVSMGLLLGLATIMLL